MTLSVTTIGFDADDTLWENEQFFRSSEKHFANLLAPYADIADLPQRLLEVEKRNLESYGFGIKGFTLSLVETAVEVTEGKVPATIIAEILDAGREMLRHPVQTLPHVAETLEQLTGRYKLVLVTKGDLFDQERKLAQSGLGDFFDAIEIVSNKDTGTYERVFSRHGNGAERGLMIGNSLKSDIVPAIEAGAWGIFVPHELTWVLEHVEAPIENPRFRQIEHLGQLTTLLEEIG
ncbi:putative hydrolase of the HAD superfamily [Phyllobacterium ifriqiyense]